MGGPWEDYQPKAAAPDAAPWLDYQPVKAPKVEPAKAPELPPLPATGPGRLFGAMENEISAAMQGTTPVVRKFSGELNYEPLGELTEADYGPVYIGPDGKWNDVNAKDHVILLDPQTNRQMVYKRDPAKEEGALARIGRMMAPGLATVAPTRLPGGVAKAAEAVMAAPTEQAQLVQAAQRQGISLPPAAVTDNTSLTSAAKKLSDVEFVGEPIRKGIGQAAEAVEEGVTGAADAFGRSRTFQQGGEGILAGVERFGERAKDYPAERFRAVLQRPIGETGLRNKQAAAYNKVRQALPKDAVGSLDNTRLAIQDMVALNAEAGLEGLRSTGRLGEILDVANDPTKELTFNGMQRLRTLLRETKHSGEVKTISDREIDSLYGAMTADLYGMTARNGGERAATLLRRADDLTRLGEERISGVLKSLGQKEPEGAAGVLLQWAQPGKQGALAKLRAVRRSVAEDEWNELASAAIHQMGMGRDGGFSLAKLVTEYSKLTPDAKSVLFRSTGNSAVASNLDDLVTVAKSLKKVEGFGNPSGSGKVAVAAGMGTGAILDPISTASVIGGGRLAAHILASPKLTAWLTRGVRLQNEAATAASPAARAQAQQQWVAHVAKLRLFADANPEIAPGLTKYADALLGGGAQTAPDPQGTQPNPQ